MDTFITEVRLHHTLYTGLANQIYGPNNEASLPQKPNNGLSLIDIPIKIPISSTTTTSTSTERPVLQTTKLPIIEISSK